VEVALERRLRVKQKQPKLGSILAFLKHFQEPAPELHFLISNPRVKTEKCCNGASVKQGLTNEATPGAKRSKSR
jgi:hypothetical protein